MKPSSPLLLALLVTCAHTQAQTVITTDGSNAANLESISIDGTVYSGSDLIGVEITSFAMYNSSNITYQIVASGAGSQTGAAATSLMEDSSLSSGYGGLVSDSFNFLSPIVNRDGADIFIFEYNASESAEYNVTLNGTTINIAASGNPFSSTGATVNTDLYRNTSTPATSIAVLESLSWDYNQAHTGVSIAYYAIDLSDYGVLNGESVSSITLAGSGDWDLTAVVGLAAIPEPSTYGLFVGALALVSMMLRRRK